MSAKEAPRVGLLKALAAKRVTTGEVAAALGVSARQVRRWRRRFEAEGAPGLLHRGRGRPSRRRVAPQVQQQVRELLTTQYPDLNDCHATEKLRELHALPISRATVRRLRRALGQPAKRRRRPRAYRARRPPHARMGALVQIDASPFAWLGDRGPTMSLHGAIDDATGTVLALHFRPTEDLHGYTTVLTTVAADYGLPLALYGDRLGVFVRNDPHWTLAEQLRGRQRPTHFGAMLERLGIAFIAAGSPQAKGRIERLWQTLQDRLVAELRLRGITSREAANAFLPAFVADFNRRFARSPAHPHAAWRRPPRELPLLLSCRYARRVAADNTVRLGLRWVQLPPGPGRRSWAGQRVELCELLDGRLVVLHAARVLAQHPAPGPDFVLRPRSTSRDRQRQIRRSGPPAPVSSPSVAPRATRSARPTSAHPWRQGTTRRSQALHRAWRTRTFSLNS